MSRAQAHMTEQPKIYYLENTLAPEKNKALYRQGIRALLEIAEKYGSDETHQKAN